MRKFLKWLTIVPVILFSGLFIAIEFLQNKQFDAPYPVITASKDSAIVARGRALALGPAHCASCHGGVSIKDASVPAEDIPLSGGRIFDIGIGLIYAPNITQHETGIAGKTDGALARALRYGVRSNGTVLFDFMPFHNTSDEDLTAIISFLRNQPGVNNSVPANDLNLLGKAVKAFLLKPIGPDDEPAKAMMRDSTSAYGAYLAASVANCRGCHTKRDPLTGKLIGENFAGGMKMDIKTDSGKYFFLTPNLTPDKKTGRIYGWSQSQFISRFRAGRIYKQSEMPWEPFSRMSDDELKAIYKFLQTVKPVHNKVPAGIIKEN